MLQVKKVLSNCFKYGKVGHLVQIWEQINEKKRREMCKKTKENNQELEEYNEEDVVKKSRDSSNMVSNLELLGDATVKDDKSRYYLGNDGSEMEDSYIDSTVESERDYWVCL